jgi:hypothetical protein
VLCHQCMKGKATWKHKKFPPFQLSRYPSCCTMNASFNIFCAPSFINLGTRFLLKGRVVTPRVTRMLIFIIRPLIKS